MNKTAYAALSLLALLPCLATQADTQHTIYDRSLALQHGLQNNKDLAAARVAVNRAESRLEATALPPNPELEVEWVDDFAFNNEGEGSFSIGLSQAFPLAGRLNKEKNVSKLEVHLAKLEIKAYEWKLACEIVDFALDIHLVDKRKQNLVALRQKLSELSSFAREKANTGEISPLDADQIRLELSVLDQEIQSLDLERERTIHRFSPLLGEISTEHIAFTHEQSLPYQNEPLPAFDQSVLDRSPAYQIALLREKISSAETILAESKNWDSITAKLFWEKERSIDEPIGPKSDQLIGISFSVPLPIRKAGKLLSRERQLQQQQDLLTTQALQFKLENEVDHARHEVTIFQRQMEMYDSSVLQAADQQLDNLHQAYLHGQIDLLTVLRNQEQRLRLENGYLELYASYAHALIELERARFDLPELSPLLP